MKNLVVFYSRTGNSKNIAILTARKLDADLDEIISLKNYSGVLGFIKAGHDALKNKTVPIKFLKKVKDYDIVVIISPNWGGKMASPVFSYIKLNDLKEKILCICCVQGSSGGEKVIEQMEECIGKRAKNSLIFNKADFKEHRYIEMINNFVKGLKLI